MKIVSATISAMPRSFTDPMPAVTVTFSDSSVKELFTFYPDEISFRPSEFVGLTEAEALDLRRRRDLAYLQS